MQRQCEIITSQQLTDSVYAITMVAGEIGERAAPGQFLHIRCGDRTLLRRPVSICDGREGFIKIIFQVKGEGTRWLSQKKSGALDVLGPLGNGFDLSGRNILLAGGGIGVPPMLYAARRALGITTAVLGFTSRDEMILHTHFRDCCKRVTVTTDDGSYGEQGLVTGPLERYLQSGGYDGILACGPTPMLRGVAELGARYGVPTQVSLEQRMACGVGACLVCTVNTTDGRNRRVCKDGPVFPAQEVDWNE